MLVTFTNKTLSAGLKNSILCDLTNDEALADLELDVQRDDGRVEIYCQHTGDLLIIAEGEFTIEN